MTDIAAANARASTDASAAYTITDAITAASAFAITDASAACTIAIGGCGFFVGFCVDAFL